MNFRCLALLFLVALALDACKIHLKVKSKTKTPFQIQVFIPSLKQKTERVTFSGPGEKKVMVGDIVYVVCLNWNLEYCFCLD